MCNRFVCATSTCRFVCATCHFVRATLILCARIFAPLGPPYTQRLDEPVRKESKGTANVRAILSHSRMPAALARRASQKIITSAPTGEWTIAEVNLKKFHTVLHKTVLPKELLVHGVEEQGVTDYIVEAFNHARTSYNPENPIHLLAIIASIACAGLLPAIFAHEEDLNGSVPSNQSHYATYLQQMDWVTKPNKNGGKGVNDKALFMRVLMWYILCFYDGESNVLTLAAKTGLLGKTASGSASIVSRKISLERRSDAQHPCHFKARKESQGCSCVGWAWRQHRRRRRSRCRYGGQDVHPLGPLAIKSLHENVVRRLKSDDKYGGYNPVYDGNKDSGPPEQKWICLPTRNRDDPGLHLCLNL